MVKLSNTYKEVLSNVEGEEISVKINTYDNNESVYILRDYKGYEFVLSEEEVLKLAHKSNQHVTRKNSLFGLEG